MISGTLPNNTVWWLSKDGIKIWIESRDLEHSKFKEKGYNIAHGRIFHARKDVGELATSRLDSRRGKDAWVIKLQAMIDVYPELEEEIQRKEIEDKKKKNVKSSKNNRHDNIVKKEPERVISNNIVKKEPEREISDDSKEICTSNNIVKNEISNNIVKEPKKDKAPIKDYFDINLPYVTWIKDEIDKSENRKMVISSKNLKEKMGEEYINMHDIRIHFGLKKILSNIGITVESRNIKGESVVVMKKIL